MEEVDRGLFHLNRREVRAGLFGGIRPKVCTVLERGLLLVSVPLYRMKPCGHTRNNNGEISLRKIILPDCHSGYSCRSLSV